MNERGNPWDQDPRASRRDRSGPGPGQRGADRGERSRPSPIRPSQQDADREEPAARPWSPGGRVQPGRHATSDGREPDAWSEDARQQADPYGDRAARPRAAARRRGSKSAPRRRKLKIAAWIAAGIVLATAATGSYIYEHLFGQIQSVSLAGLKNRPAAPQADANGNTPQNILVLGSQTRDGQSGPHIGNASKLGTDISDTTMLVHINAERKWAVVVSIPRDLLVPRPQCQGRTDPNATVPAANAAMFDLAMNLGGPACAVATVEQMTGIRVDHFVEVTFNAFQQLTTAVGGVTVCIPPPGINDPNYSGLVLSPGLHTISGGQALEFIRDRHGVGTGTDLGRIQYQQMFVSSLFTKLTSAGTLSDPLTLYKIANAVTGNLTVDDGLKSVSAMVALAQSVRSLKSHYIQFITAPYVFDPVDQNRVDPGPGFEAAWTDLRNDEPLPGSNAATAFGTTATTSASASAPSANSPTAATVPLSSLTVKVYNGTNTAHLAANAAANLKALGVNTSIGSSGYSGYAKTEIYYRPGQQAQAQALADQIVGAETKQNTAVPGLTLVIGQNAPVNITAPATTSPATAAGNASPSATPTISAESRTGDQNICSNLPTPVRYGGHP